MHLFGKHKQGILFPRSHLINWETEDTGKCGGRVKHRESVDLVRYEVHLNTFILNTKNSFSGVLILAQHKQNITLCLLQTSIS